MAKNCINCGAQLEDDATVGAVCGAQSEAQTLPNEPHFSTAAEHEAYLMGLRAAMGEPETEPEPATEPEQAAEPEQVTESEPQAEPEPEQPEPSVEEIPRIDAEPQVRFEAPEAQEYDVPVPKKSGKKLLWAIIALAAAACVTVVVLFLTGVLGGK